MALEVGAFEGAKWIRYHRVVWDPAQSPNFYSDLIGINFVLNLNSKPIRARDIALVLEGIGSTIL